MSSSVLGVAFAFCLGGLLTASRFGGWLLQVHAHVSARRKGVDGVSISVLSLLLHSGPWSLAIVVAGLCYVWSSPNPVFLYAALFGLALAGSIIAVPLAVVYWRRRHSVTEPPLLTVERLTEIRRRFFLRNSIVFAVGLAVVLVYMSAGLPGRDLLALLGLVGGFAGGWCWSWFMWQWYGEQLKVNEAARLKRQQVK